MRIAAKILTIERLERRRLLSVGAFGNDQDIGAPAMSGSASYAGGTYSIAGGGADIGGAGAQPEERWSAPVAG